MVGRLVEQKHVRLRRDHPRKGSTPRLTTGKMIRLLFAGQPQMFEKIGDAMQVVGRPQPCFHISAHIGEAVHVRHLWQIADSCKGMFENLARCRFHHTGSNLEQGRFTRTITPDQRDAVAFAHRKACILQKRRAPEGELDLVEAKEWWCHGSLR